MKKDNLIKGAAVLGVLTLMAGGVVAADAATNNATIKNLNKTTGEQDWKHGQGQGNGQMAGLTETQRTAKIAENQAAKATRQAEMKTKRDEIEAAIKANDYTAWVKAVGTANPITQKITKDNFAKFVEAHNLIEQARVKFTELGLKNGEGKGLGMGIGVGAGHMMDK